MVIENPYTQPHYLTTYFPIRPKVIHKDRTLDGDFYKKPTQYWFIGCEPENNFIFEPLEHTEKYTVKTPMKGDLPRGVKRSLMHPQYAERFIKRYLLDGEQIADRLS